MAQGPTALGAVQTQNTPMSSASKADDLRAQLHSPSGRPVRSLAPLNWAHAAGLKIVV